MRRIANPPNSMEDKASNKRKNKQIIKNKQSYSNYELEFNRIRMA